MLQKQMERKSRRAIQFNDLPLDVTTEIFSQFVAGEDSNLNDMGKVGHRPACDKGPLLLGQICRSWRNLALATPYLWSSLSVTTSSNGQGLKPRIELIRLWLARSSAQPLSFTLDIPSDYQHEEVFDLFAGHLNRWKRAKINLPPTRDLRLGGADTPLLEELHLVCDHDEVDINVTLTSAPRLRDLFWAIGNSPFATQIPWGQLTTLYIIPPLTSQEVFYVFQHCPILEACYLADLEQDGNVPEITLVSLRKLTALALVSMDDSSPVDFALSSLILPALDEAGHPDSLQRLATCFIHFSPFAVPVLPDSSTPQRQLISDSKTGKVLHRCLDSSDGTLAEMVESRLEPFLTVTPSLLPHYRTVDIIFLQGHEKDRARLQQLKSDGLDVVMNQI
ncbi:hypothetical protein C8J57DRAFT_1494367 [Mycena rebaudengoi]|nr:hypothetical protein C8J57DRAFT_1494367 [Mycena rebaudengoi]